MISHIHWLCFHYETYVGISQYRTPLYYIYTCCMAHMLYSNECYWAWAIHHLMVVCHVSRLYTSLRRWKFWTVVWENTNGVHFRAVWKNTAHIQGIRCSPEGSHLIPWTSAVFSNTALKWTPFVYRKFIPDYYLQRWNISVKTMENKGFFQFEIIITVS